MRKSTSCVTDCRAHAIVFLRLYRVNYVTPQEYPSVTCAHRSSQLLFIHSYMRARLHVCIMLTDDTVVGCNNVQSIPAIKFIQLYYTGFIGQLFLHEPGINLAGYKRSKALIIQYCFFSVVYRSEISILSAK